MSPTTLIIAALPALLGSFLLLNFVAAPRALLAQQAAVAIVAVVAAIFALRYAKIAPTVKRAPWLLMGMAMLVCAPILLTSSAPHRWLGMFGFRLYIAPVVLPLFLLHWHRALSGDKITINLSMIAALVAGVGLIVQPDAAQLTAFAIASVPLIWISNGSLSMRLLPIGLLLGAAAFSWNIPDPLTPVPYVEGVFILASKLSVWALLGAVIAVALPVISLGLFAYRMRSLGVFSVSLYFATLYLLAPAQVTPVPLLGFGAGPILGYFLMVSQVRRFNSKAV
jgi:hypothetical protein